MDRVLVIGLDGFCPELVDIWLPELPNLGSLMERGIYGPLQSIIQPVTPAAWTAMISGRNPGHYGFTDFTYRVGKSYSDFKLVHSRVIPVPTLYTLLPKAGYRILMIGVPISYPPIAIPDGACVSCFMAPSLKAGITQPVELQQEILAQTSSPYLLDVSLADMPGEVDRDDLMQRIRELDRQRFDIARHLMDTQPWDLLFMVCMGTDRVGHYFMRFQDPHHARYDADPRYRDVIRNHYRYCDERIGELIAHAGPDTTVLVVSDHGLQRLDGKINLNDWLAANGYLCLRESVHALTPLKKAPIDWSRTQAWAQGYGGQIYLNIQEREPQGCVPLAQVETVLEELERRLQELPGPNGERLQVDVIRRQDIYSGPYADNCPDLFVQCENLRYTSSDLLGHDSLVSSVKDLGPDDAAHAPAGFFAMAGPTVPCLGLFTAIHLLDVAPTVLDLMGVAVPQDLDGHPIHKMDHIYSPEDEAELTNRLRALYLE